MIFRQIQMPMVPVWFLIISSLVSFNKMYGDAIDVTHFCYEVTGQPTQVRLVVNILVKTGESFAKVYAFDASSGDTTQSANRIADAACIKDDTGISDTLPITYDMTITTTDASHSCGIQVATEGSDTVVKFVFRIYTNSETVNHPDDVTYEATCKMSDLTGIEIPTAQLETTNRANTVSQRQADGAFLTLVDDENKVVNIARVGDKVRLQAEYYPNLQKGPDNCGDDFYVGFLGIDPLSGVSASELYVIITPKYNLDTDVVVTTKHGTATYNFVDGNSQKIVFPSDLMGCSDGGVSEIEDKGVHIQALSQVREICVVVCSKETGLGDCYDALPNDVLGTDYIAASMPAADESSEFMIISHADDNEVTVDIPDGYSHIIELSGQTTTAAGGTITFTLNQRQAFHLAQTSATASMSNVNGYHITSTKQVSVISGNRLYGSNHAVTQLPPTTKAGEKYVLIPVDIDSDGRLTTYIIQPVEAGDTEVIRYLTETTSDSYTVPYGEYLSLEVDTTPFEITSDKPISVTQIVNGPINSGTAGSSMTWIPPVNRWSSVYTISHPEYVTTPLTVFKSQEDADAYRVKVGDGNPIAITPPRVDVAGLKFIFLTFSVEFR
ncbi:uncharacterized protein LOC132747567 [Ruditapes philippinarum]|uniref:uncharacterized protein LOC132747567 n=1 Tax=Ruditapes philippinarum TaxID=129788 RepID=UPI00295B7FE2|nr:uncharacterized protein LOC132747567 [Ruditapes philippinarum]